MAISNETKNFIANMILLAGIAILQQPYFTAMDMRDQIRYGGMLALAVMIPYIQDLISIGKELYFKSDEPIG